MEKVTAQKNILIAFLLNFCFTIIEIVSGIFTNSIMILGDALHDSLDCVSIAISYFLERQATHKADDKHPFGYARFRTLGAGITCLILIFGSVIVLWQGVKRLIEPQVTNGKLIFVVSILGVICNGVAVIKTSKSKNINEKAICLHILEEVLGWAVVFVGSIFIMVFKIDIVDTLLSMGVAVFIMITAIVNLIKVVNILLDKTAKVDLTKLKRQIVDIIGKNVEFDLLVWSLDGENNYAICKLSSQIDKQKVLAIKTLSQEYSIVDFVVETGFN